MSFDDSDSLSSSFASAFSLPPPARKSPKPSEQGATDVGTESQLIIGAEENDNGASSPPAASLATGSSAPTGDASDVTNPQETAQAEAPAPTEDWKSLLDQNLDVWRAESSVAREKAESTRLKLAEEQAKENARLDQEKKDAARRQKEDEEEKEIEAKLRAALLTQSNKSRAGKAKKASAIAHERRWENVREAWQIVRDDGENAGSTETPVPEVVVDGRDRVDSDIGGHDAQAAHDFLEGLEEEVRKITHATHDPTPAESQRRSDLVHAANVDARSAEERREAVAKAWKGAGDADKGKQPASPRATSGRSGDDAKSPTASMSVPHSTSAAVREATEPVPTGITPAGLSKSDEATGEQSSSPEPSQRQPKPSSSPPEQPPSLTLSLFTIPTHRSLLRISAVLGINLILPFINGVMLGFGEIFARETVAWTKRWWRGEVSWRGPGSSTANVGLRAGARRSDSVSGSGEFP